MSRPLQLSLHLGAHKTATTHLQKSLQNSQKMLASRGVQFFGPRYMRNAENGLATAFSLRPDSDVLTAELLAQMAQGGKRVVISEENGLGAALSPMFSSVPYPAGDQRVEEVLSRLDGVEVTLFLGVRDPAGWLASMYRQRLWAGEWQPFDAFLGAHDPLVMRWSNLLERLRRLENVAQIFVWRHEDYPKVSGPVLRRMVGWRLGPKVPRIDGLVNEGLSAEAVAELVRIGTPPSGDPREAVRQVRDRLAQVGAGQAFAPWPTALLDESAAHYAEDIARLAALDRVTLLEPSRRSSALGPEGA